MFAGIDGQQNVLLSAQLQRLLCHHGETANAFVFCHQMQPELQKGPTCGFAVLLMALRCSVGDVTLDRLVEMGKHFGITYNGELFSADWMCEFVQKHWPNACELRVAQFPSPNSIVRHLISGKKPRHQCTTTVLVPYDCDKNFEPCNRQGVAAHWAIIIGFVIFDVTAQNGPENENSKIIAFDENDFRWDGFDNEHLLYLIALQGKSRQPTLWSYKALRESNGQLNVPNPSGNFRLAPEGMEAIRGKLPRELYDSFCLRRTINRTFKSDVCCLIVHRQFKMATNIIAGVSSVIGERPKGWKVVQKSLPRIMDYGRNEGILQIREFQRGGDASNIPGLVIAAQEGLEAQHAKENKGGDKVNLPTNDITLMHEAIPFLPFPVALACLFLNIVLPGSGTILSGAAALCMGQPRVNIKEGRKLVTLLVNLLVGISQFFTITFMFVGWFWSIAWGGLIIIHAMQYREALQQRRQEAVATAAIEALTKDSILHRRDVKTLVRQHKDKGKEEKERAKGGAETAPNSNGTAGTTQQQKEEADTAAQQQRQKTIQNGHPNGICV
ncbi:hypothetical protein niasHS_011020 [Heterodera schachtii]|uniref:Actin maturation protease n=1 Tax=Heterodera schachtii TaxID=97005 RepID=A0ABD2IUC6_HETSC